jgi:hypothetical protein
MPPMFKMPLQLVRHLPVVSAVVDSCRVQPPPLQGGAIVVFANRLSDVLVSRLRIREAAGTHSGLIHNIGSNDTSSGAYSPISAARPLK